MKYKKINKASCYCTTICRASNAVMDLYDTALAQAGITAKQYALLVNLERIESASIAELAEHVNLERSTVARNLKLLISKGWLDDISAKNKKRHIYAVTDFGKHQIEISKPIWESCQRVIQTILGAETAQRLIETLYRLQELQKEA